MKKQLLAGVIVALTPITACGSDDQSSSTPAGSDTEKVNVVAAENFYGDIATQIGGDLISVTSILNDQEVDPHSYEPGTEAGLAIANADLIIENGLDYDHFMEDLVEASPNSDRQVLTISEVLDKSETDNPHLWYDVSRLGDMSNAIASSLSEIDPDNASTYEANKDAFDQSLSPLYGAIAGIKLASPGAGVVATEPVAGYMVEDAGLADKTPPAFAQAVEEENEPSAAALNEMLTLLASGDVKVLLYNTQTTTNLTTQVQTVAEAAGVKVVGVSETMPNGTTFVQWQTDQVKALQEALA